MLDERKGLIKELGIFIALLTLDKENENTEAAIKVFMKKLPKYFSREEIELLDHTIRSSKLLYQFLNATLKRKDD